MHLFNAAILVLSTSCCALGQTYTIQTFAGNGTPGFGGDNGPATGAQLNQPRGVAVDSAGNVYIADSSNNCVRKVSQGVTTTVPGGGTGGDNGSATSAQLFLPMGVAVDSAGNLYIADTGHSSVRKVSNGVITTVAGNGTMGFHGEGDDGPATSAQLDAPRAVAVDSAGNLYIADAGTGRIRKVSNGMITTVAGGAPIQENSDNIPATSAYLGEPDGVAVDSAGNLYIANTTPIGIYKVSNGVLTSIAGNGLAPYGAALDSTGNLYITDLLGFVFRISNGMVATVAGNGVYGYGGDGGPAISAQLTEPAGIAVDSTGRVYVADTSNNRIRVLIPSGQASTPSIGAVTNAASNLSGAISPGEIVVLYGSGIGPAQIVKAAPGSDGSYGTQLANTSVSVNGIAAPMVYAWASQTAAIVPYGVTGTTAQVTVTYQGQTSGMLPVSISPSAPGIFTYDSTGLGPAAAINQDGITLNTAATPAQIGDVISLYATGEGQTTPAGVDGKPASVPYPYPNLPVTATVGGQDAPVTYAGGAPGLVAGLMQVNIGIPAGIQTGNAVPVVLRVGNLSSQGGVTIAVR